MSATHVRVDGIALIISLLFASLLVLLASSFYILYADIELKLISDVRERFEEENLQFSVDFNGRDGVISGSVTNEKERQEVITLAKSVEGVRTIHDELTIISSPDATINNTQEALPIQLLGITGNTGGNQLIVESLGNITSSIPASSDPDISSYDVIEEVNASENLTVMTEKPIIEEASLYFELETIELSSEHTVSLDSVAVKLNNDPLLFIEISSSHSKSAIAIKRADIIKDFFVEKGLDKKRFDVIWDGVENKNQVQLKLFQNK
ncbi:MAG: BON domain-containing protein [Cocleimonas sp.]|nr:BON domain-containing protein [Cocleimonas sp.]